MVPHLTGIRAEDAVHVGPDGDAGAVEEGAQDGGAVVAAVALQRGHLPQRRLGYEASRDYDLRTVSSTSKKVRVGGWGRNQRALSRFSSLLS